MKKRLAFAFFARRYFKRVNRKRRKNDGKSGNIMVIKVDGLGDFVLFLDALKALREHFKDKRITLVCGSNVCDIARKSGYADEIIIFHQEDFLHTRPFIKRYSSLKSRKYDLLLSPGQPRSVGEDLFAMLINAKERVASLGEAGSLDKKIKDRLDIIYDRLIDTGENMTLVQTAIFLRGVGLSGYLASPPVVTFPIKANIYAPANYFIVFLGGSEKHKKWSATRYRHIADQVAERTGWQCLILGDMRDKQEEEEFLSSGDGAVLSYVGKTNLKELFYLISKAKFVLGNDTSAIHIANALGVKSVCVKGVFSGEKFFPYVSEKPCSTMPIAVCISKEEMPCYHCTSKPREEHYKCIGGYYGASPTACLAAVGEDEVREATFRLIDSIC